jgi:hypothetical protein
VREQLQLAVVRRRDRDGAALQQMLQQRPRQRGALLGVGARCQLVQQDKRPRAGALQQRDDV